jgi:hypothetical protein
MAAAAAWGVDQARENPAGRWIKLVRISPPRVDQARENAWIMLVRNDTQVGNLGNGLLHLANCGMSSFIDLDAMIGSVIRRQH